MKKFICIIFILFTAAPNYSEWIAKNAGTRGADFLRIEAGARHAALGGTYTSYGSSVFSLFGQPAAIAEKERYEIGFQYNEWVQGISHQFAGAQFPIGKGRIGLTATMLGADDIERTTDDAFGRFGVSSGTFGVNDFAGGIYYAQKITDRTSVGAGGKYIRSKIDNVSADGFALDLGIRQNVNDMITIGASASNIGTGLKFIGDRSSLPVTGRIGGSVKFGNWLMATEITYEGEDNLEGMAGVEWKPIDLLMLRAGYKTQMNNDLNEGITAGVGIAVKSLELDYAFVPFGPLGETHRVSGSFSF